MKTTRFCKRCVLPERFPRSDFDSNGVCRFCREAVPRRKARAQKRRSLRAEFGRLIQQQKGCAPYDVLVCLSGGKDSSYALYLFRRVYRLKTLAFTFDNGFCPEATLRNIRQVTRSLGSDHVFSSPPFGLLKRVFKASIEEEGIHPAKSVERASAVCTSCISFVKYGALKTALEMGIPFIGFGWTPGQAPLDAALLKLQPAMLSGLARAGQKPLEKVSGADLSAYFPSERAFFEAERIPTFVHPSAFEPVSEKKVLAGVRKLGWKRPRGLDQNSTNCVLNSFAVRSHTERYGYNPYAFEIATLVREGIMGRREGLRRVRDRGNPEAIRVARRKLGIRKV